MTTPAPGRFRQARAAIVADLAAAFAPIPVEPHFGPFDVATLKAIGAKAPVVKLAIVGPNPTRPRAGGDREADLMVSAFIVMKSVPGLGADDAALDLAETIAARIHKRTFGLKFLEPPCEVVIDNHWSGKLLEAAGANLALFSVSWSQLVIFGTATAPSAAQLVAAPPGTSVDWSVDGAEPSPILKEPA